MCDVRGDVCFREMESMGFLGALFEGNGLDWDERPGIGNGNGNDVHILVGAEYGFSESYSLFVRTIYPVFSILYV